MFDMIKILPLLLVLGGGAYGYHNLKMAENAATIAQLQQNNDRLKTNNTRLEDNFNKAKAELERAEENLRVQLKAVGEMTGRLAAVQAERDEYLSIFRRHDLTKLARVNQVSRSNPVSIRVLRMSSVRSKKIHGRLQMRILSLLLIAFLTGCSTMRPAPMVEPEPIVQTVTEFKTLEIYQPPLPEAIDLEDVEFFVITESNFEEQVARLEKMQGGVFVLFGLTPQDYENMAYNLQELRRYVRQQKEIILYYRSATQGDANTDSDDWAERNKEVVSRSVDKPIDIVYYISLSI